MSPLYKHLYLGVYFQGLSCSPDGCPNDRSSVFINPSCAILQYSISHIIMNITLVQFQVHSFILCVYGVRRFFSMLCVYLKFSVRYLKFCRSGFPGSSRRNMPSCFWSVLCFFDLLPMTYPKKRCHQNRTQINRYENILLDLSRFF